MKKTIKLALVLGASLAAAMHAFGANHPRVVKEGKSASEIVTSPKGTTTPRVVQSLRDRLIYGNLATKYPKGMYWCCSGFSLTGAGEGLETWAAAAFTPTKNATVTKVSVAVEFIASKNTYDVILSLNADDNGVPGQALETWKIEFPDGQPVFGSCCTVQSQTGSILVSANTPYWVVLSTEADSDISAAWNLSDHNQIDTIPVALYIYGGWTASSNLPPAFAVYGH